MDSRYQSMKNTIVLSVTVLLALSVTPAYALEVDMRAGETTLNLPGQAQPVLMWGYALGADPISVPGPLLQIPDGDTELVVHLTNELSVPVSMIIPALPAHLDPVRGVDGRVTSFTSVTNPGDTQTYTWSNVRPGTFLYHSGTHPAVQVQMGLYGGVTKNAAAGEAYPGVAFENEVVLLYSEVDVALHEAIASDDYGPGKSVTSTIDYNPGYFLVNGAPYPLAAPVYPAAAPHDLMTNERVLVRFLNAGLKTHVPMVYGAWMNVVAEDGRPYDHPRRQYTAMLPAGKTADGILDIDSAGDIPVIDRAHNLTSGGASGGGMLTYLTVIEAPNIPATLPDTYSTDEDTVLTVDAANGLLANDTGDAPLTVELISAPGVGTLDLQSDGSFSYTAPANFNGGVTFTYRAVSGGAPSVATLVSIQVDPMNDSPTAADDAYVAVAGTSLGVDAPGLLDNDSDLDGDTLEATLLTPPTGGTAFVNPDGSFVYVPGPGTVSDSFTYDASDGTASSGPATVTITVVYPPNEPPTAVDDYVTITKNTHIIINVVANDYDTDGTVDPASVAVVTLPVRGGSVVNNGNGTITYNPRKNFKGTDMFSYVVSDNDGASSGLARVRINVVK